MNLMLDIVKQAERDSHKNKSLEDVSTMVGQIEIFTRKVMHNTGGYCATTKLQTTFKLDGKRIARSKLFQLLGD